MKTLNILQLDSVHESIEKTDLLGAAETEHVASITLE